LTLTFIPWDEAKLRSTGRRQDCEWASMYEASNFSRCSIDEARFAPVLKLFPHVLRFKAEDVTDGEKGKEPVPIIAKKPFPSLLSFLHTASVGLELFAETEEGIFEDRIHQGRLRTHGGEAASIVEEFLWSRANAGGPLIAGGTVGGYGLVRSTPEKGVTCAVHVVFLRTNNIQECRMPSICEAGSRASLAPPLSRRGELQILR
jgi:hypothetical protein